MESSGSTTSPRPVPDFSQDAGGNALSAFLASEPPLPNFHLCILIVRGEIMNGVHFGYYSHGYPFQPWSGIERGNITNGSPPTIAPTPKTRGLVPLQREPQTLPVARPLRMGPAPSTPDRAIPKLPGTPGLVPIRTVPRTVPGTPPEALNPAPKTPPDPAYQAGSLPARASSDRSPTAIDEAFGPGTHARLRANAAQQQAKAKAEGWSPSNPINFFPHPRLSPVAQRQGAGQNGDARIAPGSPTSHPRRDARSRSRSNPAVPKARAAIPILPKAHAGGLRVPQTPIANRVPQTPIQPNPANPIRRSS